MINQNPLEFRSSFTDAEFTLHLYKLPIESLQVMLGGFEYYGMKYDCELIQKVLNDKINLIVTRIDQ